VGFSKGKCKSDKDGQDLINNEKKTFKGEWKFYELSLVARILLKG
jgi:hypothetical protein